METMNLEQVLTYITEMRNLEIQMNEQKEAQKKWRCEYQKKYYANNPEQLAKKREYMNKRYHEKCAERIANGYIPGKKTGRPRKIKNDKD